MISGSGFGHSRLPQNLAINQKDCLDRNVLGLRAMPAETQKRPYVKWPISSARVYLLAIIVKSAARERGDAEPFLTPIFALSISGDAHSRKLLF